MTETRYILTLSCEDARGIVAAVTGFLSLKDGFIIESAQFGDASTNRFFLRIEFAAGVATPPPDALRQDFDQRIATPFGMDWQLHDKARRPRLLIMVSRYGHCLNDLLYRHGTGQLAVEIPAVVSNHEAMRKVVEWHGIPFFYLGADKAEQEAQTLRLVEEHGVDVVALARYMQVLSPAMCERLTGRAINIHHSFLPSFKGARPYHQAYEKGVKLIGATAHYVTTDLDEGPIIEQEVARVNHTDTPESLTATGQDIESRVLSRAIRYHIEHRVLINGTKTVVFT